MPEIKVAKEERGALMTRPEAYFPTLPLSGLLGANPFGLIKRFAQDVDRTFSNFLPAVETDLWAPALEMKHKNGNFIVTAELPGLTKEDVKVEVVDEALLIEGERKRVKEVKEEEFFRSERYYGKFFRSIPLPKGAKVELIKAELTDGILEVVIPVPEDKPNLRHIPIK